MHGSQQVNIELYIFLGYKDVINKVRRCLQTKNVEHIHSLLSKIKKKGKKVVSNSSVQSKQWINAKVGSSG